MFWIQLNQDYIDIQPWGEVVKFTKGDTFNVNDYNTEGKGWYVWVDDTLHLLPKEITTVINKLDIGYDDDGDVCITVGGDVYSYYKGGFVRLENTEGIVFPQNKAFWRALQGAVKEYKESQGE